MIEIANRESVACVRERGAELASLRVGGDEVIWQSRPEVWSGSAPILFPIVGRLKGGAFTHLGRRYELAKHGLVRTRELAVEQRTLDTVTLLMGADDETRASYPFEFEFRVTFSLIPRGLRVAYEVLNLGDEEMLFSLGSHPAIRLDLETAPLQDYYVELSEPETLGRYRIVDGLLSHTKEPFLNSEREIPLSAELFEQDALIFRSIRSESVAVRCRRNARVVRVDTGGAPDLGLWAKPGADYVCVEPWWGHDDPMDVDGELGRKPSIRALSPGAAFHTAITLRLSGC
jgi:galactose mutarotase-like enzyme